jgi:hypothetical protein
LLDELGNVLAGLPREDWSFLGVLRKYGAQSNLRYVLSCFQEVFFKQQQEFAGPLINFANTLRLGVFSRREVEEFALTPLEFWRPLGNAHRQLLDIIMSRVGPHPYFLQFFCHALLDRLVGGHDSDPLRAAESLLSEDLHEWFSTAVDEVFFRIPSATVQYLFLRRCHEGIATAQTLASAEISDDWIEEALARVGFRSTTRGRRNLLDSLEMHGLCTAADYSHSRLLIAAPLVYTYVSQSSAAFDRWLEKLAREVDREREVWDLYK